ncbi:Tigger transposable element-derived protein 6 [Trichinella zimbabwensis]|uniref:Tigger transposable element-derived protein 6 n=1 Tax=Trichinella zimbabwensis TaxID=268475 RepID=A0A0V1GQQ6_9BILA|nr:Tigger transposable element-derived protein 6 [Trichinella zimbabwensis]
MPHYSASHYTASALMSNRKALSVKEKVAVVNALNNARHNICSGRLCGEAKSSNTESVDVWLNSVWPALRQQYNDEDIFKGDETGVFYRLVPKQILKFKGEKCIGGKHSKSRVTVFLCANMTGTEKRKLLVIGNSKKPRCFKSAKQLPVTYAANKKAWMTATVFGSELSQWNRALEKKNRKILLLVDNCTAHYTNYPLSNISVHFFPPNTTSVVQPMDLGIIRCFKSHYRRNLILFILASASNDFGAVSLLQAIRLMYQQWMT